MKDIIKFQCVDTFGIGRNIVDFNDVDIILIGFDDYRGRPFSPYNKILVHLSYFVQFRHGSRR